MPATLSDQEQTQPSNQLDSNNRSSERLVRVFMVAGSIFILGMLLIYVVSKFAQFDGGTTDQSRLEMSDILIAAVPILLFSVILAFAKWRSRSK